MAHNDDNIKNDKTNPALSLIRQKISQIYKTEPNAKQEVEEAEASQHRSKHQVFMYNLSTSGKSLAEIQTAWHNYYVGLPDKEKHQVWQEFYAANDRSKQSTQSQSQSGSSHTWYKQTPTSHHAADESRDIKSTIIKNATKPSRHKQNIKSILFGLSMGFLSVVVLLFSFFNERFIAPFISPSRNVSSTPIIIDPNSTTVGPESKLIIPKINVELPVIVDEQSTDDKDVQKALESGVLHYPNTSYPGELGNGAIFGHSSNNILNHGKYKFAFVLLRKLEIGDTFMINYKSTRYIYKVYDKKVVKPQEVSVLGNTDKAASFALITCDPPGTSLNRLVVWGEQISPDTNKNVASKAVKDSAKPAILPSNAPSLWQRLSQWISN